LTLDEVSGHFYVVTALLWSEEFRVPTG